MKKSKFITIIILFILTASGIILFLSKAGTEAGQDYFEGTVLEHTEDRLTVRIDSSYEDLTAVLGETVEIEKEEVVRKCDFSEFPPDEKIRVLYSGINSKNRRLEYIFAVYVLSEIPED